MSLKRIKCEKIISDKIQHIGQDFSLYRNIKIFHDIGIIKEIITDNMTYYELKIYSKRPLYIHFQCAQCNVIIDIDEKDVVLKYLKIHNFIEESNDLEIYDANSMLIGLCEKCRGKTNAKTHFISKYCRIIPLDGISSREVNK